MTATNSIPRGYKQTEVGVIPEDWEVPKVDEIARVVDSLHQTPNFSADGYPMVRVTDIKAGNLNLCEALKVSEPVFREFIKNYAPKKNDIVLSRVGSYGVSSFVETDEPFCMGQNTVVIEPNVPARYLYYVLNSRGTKQQIDNGSYGSGYKSLSLKNIKELLVPLPPSPTEQRAIATALSDVDALLAAQDKLIAKKRDIKQAAMQQLLTGKQRLQKTVDSGELIVDSEGNPVYFSGEWEVKRLADICWYQEGPGVRNYQFTKQGVKLLNGTNIVKGKVALDTTNRYISEDEAFGGYSHFLVDEGDILIASSGVTIDKFHEKVAFASSEHLPLCMNTSTIRFKPNSTELLDKFLYFFLQSDCFKEPIGKQATGSAQLNFGPAHLKKIIINLPPKMAEQAAIAAVLSDMDADLAALEQQRDKTHALKQGMMQVLLTGKIRLTTN